MLTPDLPCNQDVVTRLTGLVVRPSTIAGAGLGLFTTRAFEANTPVCVYAGVILSKDEAAAVDAKGDVWSTDHPYLMEFGGDAVYADVARPHLPAHFINHASDPAQANVRFDKRPHLMIAEVVSLRALAAGEELLWRYPDSYWSREKQPR